MVSKFKDGLKSLLHQGLSEPEYYGGVFYVQIHEDYG